ncbi:hem peroxidase [Dillenia turbinata]|uniref:Peroxidase n=1 Tax=Dillenia turbinata TaxID=194707 RepID=A0AAN8V1W3_9MAGN
MCIHVLVLLFLFNLYSSTSAETPLKPGYYSQSCPKAEITVREVMKKAMTADPRNGASVMRLQFHDCFVNGCDGSVLLDDTPTMLGEKNSLPNIGSLRSFEVVDEAKAAVEKICPGVVSCADIIIMAARDAVALSGGPTWDVKLGRKDSLTACQKDSDDGVPSGQSNASFLIDIFKYFNLTVQDLVALSGSHSIGKARCFSVTPRLYNYSDVPGQPDPIFDPKYKQTLEKICPLNGDENVTLGLDATPQSFDNQYFKDLIDIKGFLHSDQTLNTNPVTREYVLLYSKDQQRFFKDFVEGMIRLGDLQSGRPGEIRKNCRVVNAH